MSKYITNCPNCGAPLTAYGRCEYCGTVINRPLQILTAQRGVKKLVCQTQIPLELGERNAEAAVEYVKRAEAAVEYVKRDIQKKMADALTDSIKFLSRRDFDPCRFEEVITVRGELWVADPDVYY